MRVRNLAARAVLITACASAAAFAQKPETSGRGFLFGAPQGSFSIRGGYSGANAQSDIFSFVTSELSLSRNDFSSVAFGADLAVSMGRRLDVVLSYDASGMEKQSDYREWQDNNGDPIEQSTAFERRSWMLSGKYYLMPNGRSLGRFAWVPTRYAPWISAGAGRTHYKLSQHGDFVDFENGNNVFRDAFESSQWGTSGQVSAGIDWSLNQRFAMTTQARYLLGKADLNGDYIGYDPIDLSGFGLTAGLTIRF